MLNWSLSRVSSNPLGAELGIFPSNEISTEDGKEAEEPPLDRIGDMRPVAYYGHLGRDFRDDVAPDQVEVEVLALNRSFLIPLLQLRTFRSGREETSLDLRIERIGAIANHEA